MFLPRLIIEFRLERGTRIRKREQFGKIFIQEDTRKMSGYTLDLFLLTQEQQSFPEVLLKIYWKVPSVLHQEFPSH